MSLKTRWSQFHRGVGISARPAVVGSERGAGSEDRTQTKALRTLKLLVMISFIFFIVFIVPVDVMMNSTSFFVKASLQ